MLKSYEDNYNILSKLFKKEQNILMTARLKNAKSLINTNCPNTFNKNMRKVNRTKDKKDLSKKIFFYITNFVKIL
jgi:hypothetical protein